MVRQNLKPTTAMKRIIETRTDWGATDATLLRRWQAKWRTGAIALLAAAQEGAGPMSFQEMLEAIAAASAAIQRSFDTVQQIVRRPGVQRFIQFIDQSPALQR